MAKAKKFDDGGSVMDMPSQDMRDPSYRKKLEREQALETSVPEFMFVGPGGSAKGLKDFLGIPQKMRSPTPEIGTLTPAALYRKNLKNLKPFDDMSSAEKKSLARNVTKIELESIREPLQQQYGNRRENATKRVLDKVTNEATRALGLNLAAGMKKGGKVKSASARADGIAIKGKTRA